MKPIRTFAFLFPMALVAGMIGNAVVPAIHAATPSHSAPAAAVPASLSLVQQPATATVTLAVTPTATNLGGLLTVSAGNFTPGESIAVTIDGFKTALGTFKASTQGTLSPTGVSIPYNAPTGMHTLRVTGNTSKRTATAAITIAALTPSISLSTTAVSPGNTITVTGKGFGRTEQVTLSLNGTALATTPAVITTTAGGAFTATVKVPSSLLRGPNTLSAIGNQSRVSAVAALTGNLPTAATLYWAGASTMSGEQANLQVLNTNGQPAHLDLTFFYDNGAPGHASLDVPAHSRATANLNTLARAGKSFGVQLAGDRTVTGQIQVTRSGKDSFVLPGTAAPQLTWYMAEGYTGLTFHETLSLLNTSTTPAQVQLRLLPFGGRTARTVSVTVAGQSTHLVDVNSLMPNQSLSVIASASQPVVITRRLTFSSDGYGITAKGGDNNPATTWIFAEGTTTTRFQTFLTILNPNTIPALVTASFYGQTGGSLGSRTVYVQALSRANIKLNDFLHASGIASVVTSNMPIVVERPEYFGSPNDPNVAGGDVYGRNGAGLNWTFPGGNTSSRNEYLLIYNPSPKTVDIKATFYGSNGKSVTKSIFVPPTVRYNVNVNTLVPGLTSDHGITLQATNGLGFVAEQTVFAPDFSTLQSTQGFAS